MKKSPIPSLSSHLAKILVVSPMLLLSGLHAEPVVRVSSIGENGMPRDIVPRKSDWNFGPGSLWTHKGWQYAAYWDDARQVSVARRKLPNGPWSVTSLPDYQRTESGDRGKGGHISRGFGDGHEKVAMGISPDGVIHLSFDHHLSTLRYRASKLPIAQDPDSHPWGPELFGPVQDHLGGPQITSVTYPSFHSDGSQFLLYMRLGGGAGSANSHLFNYEDSSWTVNTEKESQIIDLNWSGGDGTVNAYPFGLIIRDGRSHLTWCWRDTPDASTCHDLCYAYSDDFGATWKNNEGKIIGKRGQKFITADSPGVAAWPIPPGTRYVNGGSMTVDSSGRVHVIVRGEKGEPSYFQRDPASAEWTRSRVKTEGKLVPSSYQRQLVVSDGSLYHFESSAPEEWTKIASSSSSYFSDCKAGRDAQRFDHDGWVSIIGQEGKTIRVVDIQVAPGN